MTVATHAALVERQIEGFNAGSIDDVVAAYADDARFTLFSAHTLPGSEMVLEGKEAITKHMSRVLKGGIEGVTLDWISEGTGFIAWRDHGSFGPGIAFSEGHSAVLDPTA